MSDWNKRIANLIKKKLKKKVCDCDWDECLDYNKNGTNSISSKSGFKMFILQN